MRGHFWLGIVVISTFCSIRAESWTKTFGEGNNNLGYSVRRTTDGGYIIAGETDFSGNVDVYLIKTDSLGDTLWTRTFGGNDVEKGYDVQRTADSGYIITGYTGSFGAGSHDIYLIKTDADGDTLWTKTFGGGNYEWGHSVQQTTDSGYIIVGGTRSFSTDFDVYLVKTDTDGDTLWTKTFGGDDSDWGYCVQQTADDGYIITGETESFGAGVQDVYLIKTDSLGDTAWTKTFGGLHIDRGWSVQQTTDSGYIIAGETSSFHPRYDVYLIKTDAWGDTVWTKTFGESAVWDNYGYDVQQTTDGGYIVTGTFSCGATWYDVCLIKTDSLGDTTWVKLFGGNYNDCGYAVQQTADSGYIITGYIEPSNPGYADVYLIKTNSLGDTLSPGIEEPTTENRPPKTEMIVSPNPFTQTIVIRVQGLKVSEKRVNLATHDSRLTIHDIAGRVIRTFLHTDIETTHEIVWDGTDSSGKRAMAGIYFCKLEVGEFKAMKKLILLH